MKTITAVAAVLLSACQSAPTRLFTLYPVPPPAGVTRNDAAYGGAPIRVDAVHFPPALDRIEIVRDEMPGELSLSDVDHWSAPLSQAARQALAADLLQRLPAGKTIFPHLTKPAGALGLTVDVLEFKSDRHEARLQAGWVVSAADPALATSTGTVTLRTPIAGSDATATAQALSALLGRLADAIVAAL